MQYLTKQELRALFDVAYRANRWHHLAMLTAFVHGLRVSELTSIRGTDVDLNNGTLYTKRLKGSETTTQPIRRDPDPLFDETPLLALAAERKTLRLFEISPRHLDRLMLKYGTAAGIAPAKLHFHAFKHSVAMALWQQTHQLGQIQRYLGHKAASSTLVYLYEADAQAAANAFQSIQF